jgi:hypothetical protein
MFPVKGWKLILDPTDALSYSTYIVRLLSVTKGQLVLQTDIRPLQKQNLKEMKCEFKRALQMFWKRQL